MSGGALATFEATRFATGRKNSIRLEINGSRGSHRLRLRGHERPARVRRDGVDARDAGFTRVLVTEATHPYVAGLVAARPRPRLRARASPTRRSTSSTAIAEGTDPRPSFSDGLQVQRILSAVETSAEREGSWTPIDGAHVPSPALS